MKTIAVDIPKAFVPITLMISQPYVLVVTPGLPVTSVKELIAYAKTKPLAYASSGIGSTVHLGMEMLKMMTGMDMTHVPYKGSGLSMVDLMGGRVQAAITNMLTASPLATPEIRDRLSADGAEVAEPNSPEQFRALIAAEIARWTSFRRRANVKLD